MITYIELQNKKYDLMYSKKAYIHWISGSTNFEDFHYGRETVQGYLLDFPAGDPLVD